MESAYLVDTAASISPLVNTLEQCFTVRLNDTLKESFYREWMREASTLHQSGTTLQQLTEKTLKVWLTLFSEDSPARTLALQERVQDWRESEADYFTKSSEFAKKHPLNLFSLKMFRQSEPEDQLKSRKHWPASGMIVDGQLYPLPKLVQITKEKDGSVLLPTPTANSYGTNQGGENPNGKIRPSLETMARKNLWPTPRAREGADCPSERARNQPSLEAPVNMAAEKFPSPGASEYKDCGPVGSKSHIHMTEKAYLCALVKSSNQPTGKLSPMWVEWLMGLPIGHTELKPWVMEWFRCKSRQRLKS